MNAPWPDLAAQAQTPTNKTSIGIGPLRDLITVETEPVGGDWCCSRYQFATDQATLAMRAMDNEDYERAYKELAKIFEEQKR
jgi:hypothetical protein